jgi:hypothetical protein
MAGTMALVDLVEDFKSSLHDSASVFTADEDADLIRLLTLALVDMAWKRPVTRLAQVTLTAGECRYLLATYPDLSSYKTHLWDKTGFYPQPWEPGYPGAVPRVSLQRDGAAAYLVFDPAPSAAHLAVRGNVFKFWYFAKHVLGVDAADTTVAAQDRGLLLLRAQAEAMLELAMRNMAKPVQLRDGLSGTPRNSTPRAMYEALLAQFTEAR